MTKQGILLITAVILIVGIGAGAYFIFENGGEVLEEELIEESPFEEQEPLEEAEETEPMGEEEESQLLTVNYTSSGFSQAALSGSVGQVILFRNQSSFNLQVSSDPHPAHGNCPEYNMEVVSPGGEVEVELISGTCGIHNHQASSHTMTLIGN